MYNKQLLDEVFVISRIIKVEERVIFRSRRLRLITLNEILIILDITKTDRANVAENAPETDKRDLLSELEIMKQLEPHPHVIKLLGCVTESGKF